MEASRMNHRAMTLVSEDAHSCFDRMQHTALSLSTQQLGIPQTAISALLGMVQKMEFKIRTGYGISGRSFKNTSDIPFMGCCQGNAAGPPLCIALTNVLIKYTEGRCHAVSMRSPISSTPASSTASLFINDTTMFTVGARNETVNSIVRRAQNTGDVWQYGLRATGGDVRPQKCHWLLLAYLWERGIPHLASK